MLIEHASVLGALFMTITTISTVGYGEVAPLSPAGRVFTIVLIIVGGGNALYLFTAAARSRGRAGRAAPQRVHHAL